MLLADFLQGNASEKGHFVPVSRIAWEEHEWTSEQSNAQILSLLRKEKRFYGTLYFVDFQFVDASLQSTYSTVSFLVLQKNLSIFKTYS